MDAVQHILKHQRSATECYRNKDGKGTLYHLLIVVAQVIPLVVRQQQRIEALENVVEGLLQKR
jgi:hypothetical protein